MTSSFDRWEKDPFFSAAEEVQDSADRMESAYRTWILAAKDPSSLWNCDELERDLRTALGTTKWQLEEFEKAVRSSYVNNSNEDSRNRHREFVTAICDHILRIQNALNEQGISEGTSSVPSMQLDEGECNELALFLSGGQSALEDVPDVKTQDQSRRKPESTQKEAVVLDCSYISEPSAGCVDEHSHGHRRTASASPDVGSWKISISDGDLPNGQPPQFSRKVPSFSCLQSCGESASKIKWSKNGFRNLKAMNPLQEADSTLLISPQLSKGLNACYEKSKSCLDGYDDCYDKQFYGWYGALQRQLQRSQYQVQYGRPLQLIFWVVLILLLVLVTTCTLRSEHA